MSCALSDRQHVRKVLAGFQIVPVTALTTSRQGEVDAVRCVTLIPPFDLLLVPVTEPTLYQQDETSLALLKERLS